MPNQTAPYVSKGAAAEWFGVHPNTIDRWVKAGRLPERRNPSGKLVFTLDDLRGAFTNGGSTVDGAPIV